ncbi:MAG: universal stress protein [Chloroflexi bacterium]|nr:universal stress protein [Chloroflexota bacterium]
MFERILVPLDGSERAERVLPLVMHVAGWFDAELTLFHVLSPIQTRPTGSGPVATGRQVAGEIQYPDAFHDRGLSLGSAYLDEVVARLNDRGVRARMGIVAGDTADMIAARTIAGGFGLIAMTTTARLPFLRLFRRGTLRGVWPLAPVPLLVLGDNFIGAEHARELHPEGLIVPLDGSRSAEWGLLFARRVAHASGLPVLLLRSIFRPPLARVDGSEPGSGDGGDAERYLGEKAEELRSHGIEVDTRLSYSDPAHAVADEQRGEPPRMVVMSSRMRNGWQRALLGSETDEVVRRSHGGIMVIPVGRARRVARLVEDDTGTPSGPSAAQSLRTMEKR